jgi:hypothetical protein
MSYFLLTTKNTLPVQFQSSIPVENKIAIAEKLVTESFMSRANFERSMAIHRSLPITKVNTLRIVEDYTVINMTFVSLEQDAILLRDSYITTQNENAQIPERSWVHPEDPSKYTIREVSEEEWGEILVANMESNITIDPSSLVFPLDQI